MTTTGFGLVRTTALVIAVELDPESKQVAAAVAELAGLRFRSYSSVDRMLESVPTSQVGCILIPVSSDESRADAIVCRLKSSFIQLPIILAGAACSTTTAVFWMRQGAFSVLETPLVRDDLMEAVRAACQLSADAQTACEESLNASVRMQEATEKEMEVLDMVLAGLKNKEIADRLGITIRAVEDRRIRLMKKVKVDSLAALIELAVIHRRSQAEDRFSSRLFRRTNQPRCFVRGIEVWRPTEDGQRLRLTQSVYRDAGPMESISQDLSFAIDEGLPGEVWQRRAPVFYRQLNSASFVRRDAAAASGLTIGVGIPIFRDGQIQSVVLLLTDGGEFLKVALEHWKMPSETFRYQLRGGVYSNCERLRRLSEHMSFPAGHGLPGTIGQSQRPYLGTRFAEDSNAVRGVAITAEHLTSGIGLPLTDLTAENPDVLLLMNSDSTPLFRLLQIWQPAPDGRSAALVSEAFSGEKSLQSQTDQIVVQSADSLVGRTLHNQIPTVTRFAAELPASLLQSQPWRLSIGLSIPTFVKGKITAITVLGD